MAHHLIFVYGTLRKGASNAWRMDQARHVGGAAIPGRLYHIEWYPGLVRDSEASAVRGDIWEVDDEMLAQLDIYEGVATEDDEYAEYRRVATEARLDDGEVRDVWIWEWQGVQDEECRVPSGDWVKWMQELE